MIGFLTPRVMHFSCRVSQRQNNSHSLTHSLPADESEDELRCRFTSDATQKWTWVRLISCSRSSVFSSTTIPTSKRGAFQSALAVRTKNAHKSHLYLIPETRAWQGQLTSDTRTHLNTFPQPCRTHKCNNSPWPCSQVQLIKIKSPI